MKKVIITGVLGQDGATLTEYLLSGFPDQYEVYGVAKRSSNPNTINISSVKDNRNFHLVSGDITDQSSIDNIVRSVMPDYFINFAAASFVGTSWSTPEQVFNVNTLGVLRCMESIRKFKPSCRFYSAGSSEEFGEIVSVPQNESHPLIPVSPYAAAKTAARHLVGIYRKSYDLFAIHGTLYNHEGTKRGEDFVTRKITKSIAKIIKDIEDNKDKIFSFKLGNIYAKKDWSDARDMVRGVWMMVNQERPIEYILASGETRTIADFVDSGFRLAGIYGEWIISGDPLSTYYRIMVNGEYHTVITIDKSIYRPVEVGIQRGDYSAIKENLGWVPKISFDTMVRDMIENDKNLIS